MRIVNIEDKEQLNGFINSMPHSQFLQSWQWGKFQEKAAGKVIRLAVEENGELIAAATLVKRVLPMSKSYFYCPRGPIRITNFLFDEIKKIAETENVMFLRFEPLYELRVTGYRLRVKKTIDVQPSKTLILDLSKSEDELLKAMHPKTRYNIKLAGKKGAKTVEAGAERFKEFWRLLAETSERDNFRTHGINYYKAMLGLDSEFIKLFFIEFGGQAIGAGIFCFFGDTVTYLHGAFSHEHRSIMAPYLLQWRAITLARQAGYKYYDFDGIDEKRWPGVTRFKLGFGGETVNFPGTFDLIFNPGWYGIYKMVRKVRRTF